MSKQTIPLDFTTPITGKYYKPTEIMGYAQIIGKGYWYSHDTYWDADNVTFDVDSIIVDGVNCTPLFRICQNFKSDVSDAVEHAIQQHMKMLLFTNIHSEYYRPEVNEIEEYKQS